MTHALFSTLAVLQERNISFCFQCQSGNFYNLSVDDVKGRNHTFHSKDIKDIEKSLNLIWPPNYQRKGDALTFTTINKSPLTAMPLPPGM